MCASKSETDYHTTVDTNNNMASSSNHDQNSAADPRAISRDIFSASIGSICCCYAGQPFDTVRVRMQTTPLEYPTILTSTGSIFRHEGITAFWKGSVPTFSGMICENVLAFGLNGFINRAFPDDHHASNREGPPSLARPFQVGVFTGLCLAFVLVPSEVVKTKLQMVRGNNATVRHVVTEMIQKQGYSSFACGLEAQIARDSAFYACFFGGYELLKYTFATYIPQLPEQVNYFLSGGFAGCLGWAIAMPFDVPKTNVQASYTTKLVGSYLPEMDHIAQQRGLGGFYHGLGPTLARAFPANAALFLGVELGRKAFDRVF